MKLEAHTKYRVQELAVTQTGLQLAAIGLAQGAILQVEGSGLGGGTYHVQFLDMELVLDATALSHVQLIKCDE